ncbi:MAG: hypothetical protein EZS28_056059, partial [Streblomastix strix]
MDLLFWVSHELEQYSQCTSLILDRVVRTLLIYRNFKIVRHEDLRLFQVQEVLTLLINPLEVSRQQCESCYVCSPLAGPIGNDSIYRIETQSSSLQL